MTHATLTKAGLPVLEQGHFITVRVSGPFFDPIIFMMLRQVNCLQQAEPPAPPATTPKDTPVDRFFKRPFSSRRQP